MMTGNGRDHARREVLADDVPPFYQEGPGIDVPDVLSAGLMR